MLGGENLQGTHCSVEVWDQVGPGKEHLLGILLIPLDCLALPLPIILQLENEQVEYTFDVFHFQHFLIFISMTTSTRAATLLSFSHQNQV